MKIIDTITMLAIGIFLIIGMISIIERIPTNDYEIKTKKSVSTSLENTLNDDGLKEFKKGFMQECDPYRDQTAYCECGYKKIIEEYSLVELYGLSIKLDDGEVPEELIKIFYECFEHTDWSK